MSGGGERGGEDGIAGGGAELAGDCDPTGDWMGDCDCESTPVGEPTDEGFELLSVVVDEGFELLSVVVVKPASADAAGSASGCAFHIESISPRKCSSQIESMSSRKKLWEYR